MTLKAKCLLMSEGILNQPYWWDDTDLPKAQIAQGSATLPDAVETLVVGAGYSGLSAALTLARAGRDVVVVDADAIGFGCSSRNGGQIGPSFHKLGLAGLTASLGQAKAQTILRESMSTLAFLKQRIIDDAIDCDIQPDIGRFKGASRPADYETIARASEELDKSIGLRFELIPKSEQHSQIGSDHYHGGLVYLDDGLLHPAKYVLGLAHRVHEAGAKIFAPARVTGVMRDGDGFTVQIAGKTISAREVLIATNGYSGPELPFFHHRIMPIRSAIITTEPLTPDVMNNLFPTGRPVVDTSRLVPYYRPSPDGTRVVFGGRAFDLGDKPQNYVPDLKRLMTRVFPQLGDTKITHAWSGTVAYPFDHAPHLGCHDGLYYVMGYCGSGVGRASFYGHKVAQKMLGQTDGKAEIDGLNFPTRPFYRGKPWFLPAVLRWHSMMDRLGR